MHDKIIIYDSKCSFCIESVNFFMLKMRSNNISAIPLQSKEARQLLKQRKEQFIDLQTIYFIDNSTLLKRSKAILRICKYLKFPLNILSVLSVLPSKLTDFVYNLVSKNRYKISRLKSVS